MALGCHAVGWRLPIVVTFAFFMAHASVPAAGAAEGQTLGFAVTSWLTTSYETPDGKEECPQGFAVDAVRLYLNQLSPEKRNEVTRNGTADLISDRTLNRLAMARGPNGEDVCWNPTLARDPPMRTVGGRKGLGFDLDGVGSNTKTPNTCAHQNFVSPDGKKTGIDNQWYRLIGCTQGWRVLSDGYIEKNVAAELRDAGHTLLIEVTKVDNPRNDNDVGVNFYQAVEYLMKDASGSGEIVVGATFHPADEFKHTTKGRIQDGVLTTEPIDFKFALTGNTIRIHYYIRGMRLELALGPESRRVSGLVGGYFDLASMHDYMAKMSQFTGLAHFSCPAMYAAATEFADGYPDPATGRCTALSAAFNIQAVSAFIVHDDEQNVDKREKSLSQAER
jgi:hypothetical protein